MINTLHKLELSDDDMMSLQIKTAFALSDKSAIEKIEKYISLNNIDLIEVDLQDLVSEEHYNILQNVLYSISYERLLIFKKIITLLLLEYKNESYIHTEGLIKLLYGKYYNSMSDFIRTDNSMFFEKQFVLNALYSKLVNNPQKKLKYYTSASIDSAITYIAVLRKIGVYGTVDCVNFAKLQLVDLLASFRYRDKNCSKDVLEYYSEKRKMCMDKLGISNRRKYNFPDLLDVILNKNFKLKEDLTESIKQYKINSERDNTLCAVSFDDVNVLLEKFGSLSKYIGINEGFMKLLVLFAPDELNNYVVTPRDIDVLTMNCVLSMNFNLLEEQFIPVLFISELYTLVITKNYQSLKQQHIELSENGSLIAIDKLKKEISINKSEITNLKATHSSQISILEDEKKALLKEIDNLKATLKKEDSNKEELKELKEEVSKLRTFVFNQNDVINETVSEEELSLNDFNELISNKKVAFCGMPTSLTEKLKSNFKDIVIINNDRLNQDFSFIKNLDHVYINTYMSHSLYFKIIKYIKKFNIDYTYIGQNNNISIFLKSYLND